uniref:Uncharacterized protein n=1 Tax=Arundo donax TaxID=35708 RepID=A0A0A9CDM0_ARUDO
MHLHGCSSRAVAAAAAATNRNLSSTIQLPRAILLAVSLPLCPLSPCRQVSGGSEGVEMWIGFCLAYSWLVQAASAVSEPF